METVMDADTSLLFTEEACLTGVTEFGISWEELITRRTAVPPQGARFDIAFEGSFDGPRLRGRIKGVDYLEVRADGRFNLNIRATMVTDDGETISIRESGVLDTNRSPVGSGRLRLSMSFLTASTKYDWINAIEVWAEGEIDMLKGIAHVRAYS